MYFNQMGGVKFVVFSNFDVFYSLFSLTVLRLNIHNSLTSTHL